jgi:hypothetical protein
MNETQNIRTTARYLRAGDVLLGSGFVVTHNAYTSVRCPKGMIHVEGNYPDGGVKVHTWNASTTLTVVR